MLTLFHAPQSRSTRIIQLLDLMGIRDRIAIRITDIQRYDGAGGRDPANPHPEGKVPLLQHDDVAIRESTAIMLHLLTLFPQEARRVAPAPGTPEHGAFLGRMVWTGNVQEPVIVAAMAGLAHPLLTDTFRGPEEAWSVLESALAGRPFLAGEAMGPEDILAASPFLWMPSLVPDRPRIAAWVARCAGHPSYLSATAFDEECLSPVA